MDLPAEVQVHNPALGLKGRKATLLRIEAGYYEVTLQLGERFHRSLLPMEGTMLIQQQPEDLPVAEADFEVER